MRIALVCPYSFSWPGGVQSHVRALAEHLAAAGHRVAVYAPIDGGVTWPTDPASGRARPITGGDHSGWEGSAAGPQGRQVKLFSLGRSLPVPANRSVARLAFSPMVRKRLREGLESFAPEVVHLHEPLQAGVSLYMLTLARRPPTVGTFHAAADRMPFYDWFRRPLHRLLERVDVLAAVSPAARELVRTHFGDELASRVRILPNGLDVARFAVASRPLAERGLTVLFVGRLEKRKGCEVLLRAWPAILESEPRAVLRVIGDGPLRESLESAASGLSGVVFEGQVDDDALVRAYGSARVVCVPSLGSESFGIVVLEAMAAGACVVASDLAGYRWVGEGKIRLVPPDDPEALAGAVSELLRSDQEAESLSAEGRKRAADFDWERLLPDVVSTYEEAVSARTQGSRARRLP